MAKLLVCACMVLVPGLLLRTDLAEEKRVLVAMGGLVQRGKAPPKQGTC